MALKDLTDPSSVLQALEEFDSLGRDAFLKKYGFGQAKTYLLLHDDRYYDSKAIAGVAHLHQTGQLLRNSEFSGGTHGATRRLGALGFTVVTEEPELAPSRAFELILNPERSPRDAEALRAMQASIAAGGTPSRSWSTGSTKSGIQAGDRVFLFRVGPGKRGLIGSGHATGDIYFARHYDPLRTDDIPYVAIAWDAIVDPDDVLTWDAIQDIVPGFPDRFMTNGQKLDPVQAQAVDVLWQDHVDEAVLRPIGNLPPAAVKTSYSYVIAKHRNHQRRFRNLLFMHYEAVCHVCGFDQLEILEAAHLIPDAKGGRSDVENGRLMCPNHHRAHNADLFHLDENDEPVWREDDHEFLAPLRP